MILLLWSVEDDPLTQGYTMSRVNSALFGIIDITHIPTFLASSIIFPNHSWKDSADLRSKYATDCTTLIKPSLESLLSNFSGPIAASGLPPFGLLKCREPFPLE